MWESGKDECARTDAGPEAAYWWGTEFSRMGGYDFPGQIAASDGSEGNGASDGPSWMNWKISFDRTGATGWVSRMDYSKYLGTVLE